MPDPAREVTIDLNELRALGLTIDDNALCIDLGVEGSLGTVI